MLERDGVEDIFDKTYFNIKCFDTRKLSNKEVDILEKACKIIKKLQYQQYVEED